MPRYQKIAFDDKVVKKIRKWWLEKQFSKAISYLQAKNFQAVDFKLRQPKSAWIWYFRINKQYRGLAKIIDDVLFIFDIDDHS